MADKKLKATQVIADKLWITYNKDGSKAGVLRQHTKDSGLLVEHKVCGQEIEHQRSKIQDCFEFEDKKVSNIYDQRHVFGYPIPSIDTFKNQEKDNLPCYAKTQASKIFFAAGFYGINFDNGGWLESFSPKLATLRKYEFIGPFKTELDMQIAIRRKQRKLD